MACLIKRTAEGKLLAAEVDGPNTLLVQQTFRMVSDRRIDVRWFINPTTREVVYALRNPRLHMLGNKATGNTTFPAGGTLRSHPVQYTGVVFLRIPDFRITNTAWLTNAQGDVLSGSNIYGSSWRDKTWGLCLGDGVHPLSLQPVDLLLFNKANADLQWVGPPLLGSWITPERVAGQVHGKVFEITTWPVSGVSINPVPSEIVDLSFPS